jgi:hypothetical protein
MRSEVKLLLAKSGQKLDGGTIAVGKGKPPLNLMCFTYTMILSFIDCTKAVCSIDYEVSRGPSEETN